jgi:hypothetical protein
MHRASSPLHAKNANRTCPVENLSRGMLVENSPNHTKQIENIFPEIRIYIDEPAILELRIQKRTSGRARGNASPSFCTIHAGVKTRKEKPCRPPHIHLSTIALRLVARSFLHSALTPCVPNHTREKPARNLYNPKLFPVFIFSRSMGPISQKHAPRRFR